MPDLSSDLRDYFDALVEPIHDMEPPAPILTAAEPRRSGRTTWLAAGVVAAAIVGIVGLVIVRDDDPAGQVTTTDESSTTTTVVQGLDDLEPGWHPLDTGPVPPMTSANLAWTGTDLIVIGNDPGNGIVAFAYNPSEAVWRELPDIPGDREGRTDTPGLAWTGEELLMVERSSLSTHAAVWHPDTNTWEEIDPPLANRLQAAGPGMSSGGPWGGPPALIWTGEAVLDLTHGAVWSPEDRTWSELAMPDDLIPYRSLSFTTPVLVDDEVIAAPWSTSPGLAWNATGTTFHELPGIPAEIAEEGVVGDALATSVDGRVFVVSGTDEGRTASFDPQAGTWRREPDLFPASTEGCPIRVAAVADVVVARACWQEPTAALHVGADASGWASMDPNGDACCDWLTATWVEADGVLISWSTSTDSANDADAPYARAGIWVPPDSSPPDDTASASAEPVEGWDDWSIERIALPSGSPLDEGRHLYFDVDGGSMRLSLMPGVEIRSPQIDSRIDGHPVTVIEVPDSTAVLQSVAVGDGTIRLWSVDVGRDRNRQVLEAAVRSLGEEMDGDLVLPDDLTLVSERNSDSERPSGEAWRAVSPSGLVHQIGRVPITSPEHGHELVVGARLAGARALVSEPVAIWFTPQMDDPSKGTISWVDSGSRWSVSGLTDDVQEASAFMAGAPHLIVHASDADGATAGAGSASSPPGKWRPPQPKLGETLLRFDPSLFPDGGLPDGEHFGILDRVAETAEGPVVRFSLGDRVTGEEAVEARSDARAAAGVGTEPGDEVAIAHDWWTPEHGEGVYIYPDFDLPVTLPVELDALSLIVARHDGPVEVSWQQFLDHADGRGDLPYYWSGLVFITITDGRITDILSPYSP